MVKLRIEGLERGWTWERADGGSFGGRGRSLGIVV